MKKMFSIICILLVNSCSSQDTYQVYNFTDYSIEYESNWTPKIAKNNSVQFFTKKENEKDFFQENFNIIIEDLSGQNITLDSYSDLTIKQMSDVLGRDVVLKLKDVKIKKLKGKEIVYTMPLKTPNGKQEMLKFKQQWYIKDEKAYLLTYTAHKNSYTKYLRIVDNMFNSFKLK
jgi:hypothetical protein